MDTNKEALRLMGEYADLLESTGDARNNFYYRIKADAVREAIDFVKRHP